MVRVWEVGVGDLGKNDDRLLGLDLLLGWGGVGVDVCVWCVWTARGLISCVGDG